MLGNATILYRSRFLVGHSGPDVMRRDCDVSSWLAEGVPLLFQL